MKLKNIYCNSNPSVIRHWADATFPYEREGDCKKPIPYNAEWVFAIVFNLTSLIPSV